MTAASPRDERRADPATGLLPRTAVTWDGGHGRLQGWAVAVKDIFDVAGEVTMAGSAVLSDARPAPVDAEAVRRVRDAGAVYAGRTAMHEFALGVTGVNAWQGTPDNPADPGRIPGGSSSGSAVAVATGAARLALGTDTGGSVRIPAALCGIHGLKLPMDESLLRGVLPLAPTLDHAGLFTRDLATATAVLCGDDAVTASVGGDRCSGWTALRPSRMWPTLSRGRAAFSRSPCRCRWRPRWRRSQTTSCSPPAPPCCSTRRPAGHRSLFAERWKLYGSDVRDRLVTGSAIGPELYRSALRQRAIVRDAVADLLGRCHALVLPTVPCRPPTLDAARRPETAARLVANTRLANLTGHPALPLPVPGGTFPVGLQLIAANLPRLFAAAREVRSALRVLGDRQEGSR